MNKQKIVLNICVEITLENVQRPTSSEHLFFLSDCVNATTLGDICQFTLSSEIIDLLLNDNFTLLTS